jgi:tetratricopeptide (TPR) repeat protein
MSRISPLVFALVIFSVLLTAQTPTKPATQTAAKPAGQTATTAISLPRAIELAAQGHCGESMPALRAAVGRTMDKELKRQAGQAGLRCAMTYNQSADAARFIEWLRSEFPRDPEILYLATHVYSDLSVRASQELLFTNPGSPQVHQLNAEAQETQGNWKGALSEYRAVLEQNPQARGIHFRIGRLILSQPQTPTTLDDAKAEFEAELKIDPDNAAADYVLGEIARQKEQWDDAIKHFRKATELDAGLADAFIGLGRSLLSAGNVDQAIAPLAQAEKLQPANPTTHYYSALALAKAGRKADSDRAMALYKETSAKAQKQKDELNEGILGRQTIETQPQQP